MGDKALVAKEQENLRQAAFEHADDEYKSKIYTILGVINSHQLGIVNTEEQSRVCLDLMLAALENEELKRNGYTGFYLIKIMNKLPVVEVHCIDFSNRSTRKLTIEKEEYNEQDLRKQYSSTSYKYHLKLPFNYHVAVPIVEQMAKQGYLGAIMLHDMETNLSQNEQRTAITNSQVEKMLEVAREKNTSFIFIGNNYEYTQTQSHFFKVFKMPLPKLNTLRFLAKAWIDYNDVELQKLLAIPIEKSWNDVKNEMSEQIGPILLGTTIEESITMLGDVLKKTQEEWRKSNSKVAIDDFYKFLSEERITFLRGKNIQLKESQKRQLVGYEGLNEHVRTNLSIMSRLEQSNKQHKAGATALMLVGAPGTGKTTWAVELGRYLNKPVVFLDIASMFGSYVGETERNLRQALNRIKAIENVVVIIDEVDKIFKLKAEGSIGNIQDSIRGILNRFLTEESSHNTVFVLCGNRYTIPSDLTRQGRMIGVYYVPYPEPGEAWDIFRIHFNEFFSTKAEQIYSADHLKTLLADMTGAEIASFAKELFIAFDKLQEAIIAKTAEANGLDGKTDKNKIAEIAKQRAMELITSKECLTMIKNKITLVKNSKIVQELEEDIKSQGLLSIKELETGLDLLEKLNRALAKERPKDALEKSEKELKKEKKVGELFI